MNPNDIIQKVTTYYGVTIEDIRGKSRHEDMLRPRFALQFLLRENGHQWAHIGRLTNRNHASVMNAVNEAVYSLNGLMSEIEAIKGMKLATTCVVGVMSMGC